MIAALWIVSLIAQERSFAVVLPELQYSRQCSSELIVHNTSPRFVDFDVGGHRSSGGVASIIDKPVNRFRLRPAEALHLRFDVQNDTAWAVVTEFVPSPRLQPVLDISGRTECLDANELHTAAREIAPVSANPRFTLDQEAAALNGMVLLLINASDRRMQWSACYSAGSTVSDGHGAMTPLCSESLERTLAPFQSSRLAASIAGKPLVRFQASGSNVALQLLAPSAPLVNLFKVESTIRFDQ